MRGSNIFRRLRGSQKKKPENEGLLENSKKEGASLPNLREKEEKKIIEKLLNKPGGESDVPPVVAITGTAGIGKTTLARLVCEYKEVKDRFGSPIFLYAAGKTFDDLKSIAGAVSTSGGNKQRVLVLDDLRSENWESKLSELRKELASSVGAIIITTRDTCGTLVDKAMHVPLKGLNEEQSRSLFRSLYMSDKLKDAEIREILHNCNGVPLTIKLVSTFLDSRADFHPQELKHSDKFQQLLLLEPLKLQFLAYVSLFPDGYLIHGDRLVHLWVAEGFAAEETCRSVLQEFVNSGIFQDVKRKEENDDAVVKSYRVPPHMQELVWCIARVMEDSQLVLRVPFDMRSADFVSKLDSFVKEEDKRAKDVRTILFHEKVTVESPLVLGNRQEERMNEYTCDKLLSSCKALCVLDLQHLGMNMLPSSIGKLKDLTYLDLSYNNFEKLPDSITKLSALNTLKLSQCHLLKELPKDLKELTKLTHLHIDGCVNIQSMPRGISKLTSLQTLSHFVVGKNEEPMALASHEELKDLNQLKGNLEILYPERLKLQPSSSSSSSKSMDQKEHLRRLTFRCDQLDKGDKEHHEGALQVLEPHSNLTELHIVGYKGNKFPSWISSLVRLVKLSLYNCATREPLPPLDKLQCLKVLELRRMHSLQFIAEECDDRVHDEVFPSLEELTLWDCPKLQSWWRKDNNNNDGEGKNSVIFRCLSVLRIQYCPNLTRMPLYPALDEKLELVDSSVKPMLDTIHYGRSETVSKNCPVSKGLENLKSLIIREIPMLESLPMGLENAKSLQEIKVHDCAGLTSLLKGIGNLTSLVRLEICRCEKLALLPEGIEQLKSLDTLVIKDCPLLMPRCQRGTGDDWTKISHVKNILVKQT